MCRLHKKLCEAIIKLKRTDLTNGPLSAKIVPAQRIIHTLERLNFISQEVKRRMKRRPFAGKNALHFAGKGRARRIPKR